MSDFTAVRFPALHLEKEVGTNALGTTSAGSRPDQVDDETWSILEKFGIEKDMILEACITDKTREIIK